MKVGHPQIAAGPPKRRGDQIAAERGRRRLHKLALPFSLSEVLDKKVETKLQEDRSELGQAVRQQLVHHGEAIGQ